MDIRVTLTRSRIVKETTVITYPVPDFFSEETIKSILNDFAATQENKLVWEMESADESIRPCSVEKFTIADPEGE